MKLVLVFPGRGYIGGKNNIPQKLTKLGRRPKTQKGFFLFKKKFLPSFPEFATKPSKMLFTSIVERAHRCSTIENKEEGGKLLLAFIYE